MEAVEASKCNAMALRLSWYKIFNRVIFFLFPCENCVGNSQSNCIKEQSDGTCFLHFSCIQTWIIEANASLTGARYQDQSMNTEFASNGQSNSTLPRLSILQILHGRREARALVEFSNYYLYFSAITEKALWLFRFLPRKYMTEPFMQ